MTRVSGNLNTLSIGKETTPKTAVATTAFIPTTKHSAKLDYKYVSSATRNGARAQSADAIVGQEGKLTVPFEVNLTSVGHLLAGSFNDAKSGGSDPYTHTFTAGNNTTLPSFTFQDGRGAYKYFTLAGATQNTLSFDIAKDAIITGSAEYIYVTETDQAIAIVPANVATATGIITATNTFVADDQVKLFTKIGSDVLPTGLVEGQIYYINTPTGTTFKLATGPSGAGVISSYAASGTGNFELYKQEKLVAPSNRVLAFDDSNTAASVKVGGSNFGQLLNFSVTIDNKVDASEKVLGGGGNINTIISPEIVVTGKISVNFTADTASLRTLYSTGATTTLQLDFYEDATHYLRFYFPAVQLKGGEYSYDDGGITQSFDLLATGTGSVSPITVTLVNSVSTAY